MCLCVCIRYRIHCAQKINKCVWTYWRTASTRNLCNTRKMENFVFSLSQIKELVLYLLECTHSPSDIIRMGTWLLLEKFSVSGGCFWLYSSKNKFSTWRARKWFGAVLKIIASILLELTFIHFLHFKEGRQESISTFAEIDIVISPYPISIRFNKK